MATALVQPAEKDYPDIDQHLKYMNTRWREWCDEFLANGLNGKEACIKLRYKTPPAQFTAKMLSQPLVKAYIERELKRVREQYWIRREQLLNKIQRLNDFNLMKVGHRGKSGWIEIDTDEYEKVANEIGDCVTEVEVSDKGVRIRLMDKDRMFDRELKYHGILDMEGKVNINIDARQGAAIDWDKLAEPVSDMDDPIEGEILSVKVLDND